MPVNSSTCIHSLTCEGDTTAGSSGRIDRLLAVCLFSLYCQSKQVSFPSFHTFACFWQRTSWNRIKKWAWTIVWPTYSLQKCFDSLRWLIKVDISHTLILLGLMGRRPWSCISSLNVSLKVNMWIFHTSRELKWKIKAHLVYIPACRPTQHLPFDTTDQF